jgi:hypothetical protein
MEVSVLKFENLRQDFLFPVILQTLMNSYSNCVRNQELPIQGHLSRTWVL